MNGSIKNEPKEIRCPATKHLLCKITGEIVGTIEIRCRCGRTVTIPATGIPRVETEIAALAS